MLSFCAEFAVKFRLRCLRSCQRGNDYENEYIGVNFMVLNLKYFVYNFLNFKNPLGLIGVKTC